LSDERSIFFGHIGMRSLQPLGHATLQGHVWFCARFYFFFQFLWDMYGTFFTLLYDELMFVGLSITRQRAGAGGATNSGDVAC
jgi:hypothetical protein